MEKICMKNIQASFRDYKKRKMKRIKHNDLTHYFLRPHSELPRAYLDSCEKFFRELKNLKLARLTAANVQSCKHQAAGSLRDPDFLKKDKKDLTPTKSLI
jgi:hypothetical protein